MRHTDHLFKQSESILFSLEKSVSSSRRKKFSTAKRKKNSFAKIQKEERKGFGNHKKEHFRSNLIQNCWKMHAKFAKIYNVRHWYCERERESSGWPNTTLRSGIRRLPHLKVESKLLFRNNNNNNTIGNFLVENNENSPDETTEPSFDLFSQHTLSSTLTHIQHHTQTHPNNQNRRHPVERLQRIRYLWIAGRVTPDWRDTFNKVSFFCSFCCFFFSANEIPHLNNKNLQILLPIKSYLHRKGIN